MSSGTRSASPHDLHAFVTQAGGATRELATRVAVMRRAFVAFASTPCADSIVPPHAGGASLPFVVVP
jgi:hypothetical protein